MKIKFKLFCKSFLLAFLTFAILASIIITNLYLEANSVDPLHKESTILIGAVDNDKVLSLSVINFDPQNNSVSFLPIPDNVWIENGVVLQNQYNKHNISDLKKSVEKLIGTKINRYILFSIDSLEHLNNQMGQFVMTPKYPFEHNGKKMEGTLNLNGELLKSMFLYSGYDVTKVSISNIGFSYLTSFLNTYAKPYHIEKLSNILTTKSFLRDTHTDLKKKEIKLYCELLSQFSSMAQRTLELSGKYDTQPYSSTYFIPDNPNLNKNIFK